MWIEVNIKRMSTLRIVIKLSKHSKHHVGKLNIKHKNALVIPAHEFLTLFRTNLIYNFLLLMLIFLSFQLAQWKHFKQINTLCQKISLNF